MVPECSSLIRIRPAGRTPQELKLSLHGTYLVSGGGGVHVWRVRDGEQVAVMKVDDVRALAVSKDGRWITAGTSDGQVCLWDANTYKLVWSRRLRCTTINAIDFSPDSTRLVTASSSFKFALTKLLEHAATIWNVATGKQVLGPLPYDDQAIAAKFSPQGDRIAIVIRNSVRVYDSNNGRLLVGIPVMVTPSSNDDLFWSHSRLLTVSGGDISQVEGLAVSEWTVPDTDTDSRVALPQHGAFMACSTKRTVTFWDTSTHINLGVIRHSQTVRSVAFSPDDRFLAVCGVYGEVAVHSVAQFAITSIAQDLMALPHLHTFRNPDTLLDSVAFYSWGDDQLANMQMSLTASYSKSQESSHCVLAIRALVRTHLRQWDAAIDDATKSIEIEPSAIGYIAKSVALVGKGEKFGSYRACDLAFQHFQSTHVNFLLLIKAIVVFMAGDHDDAISRMDDLIITIPLNSIYCVVQAYMYLLLGNLHMQRGNLDSAIKLFRCALTRLKHDQCWPLLVISLISGWKFDSLGITIRQYLCEALYAANRVDEGGVYLSEIADTFEEGAHMGNHTVKWISDFTCRCLSSSQALNVSVSMLFVRVWLKSALASGSWKDTLALTVGFKIPRFTIYQVICEHLDKTNNTLDAIECLHHMQGNWEGKAEICDKQERWILNFKQHCAKQLVCLGDEAVVLGDRAVALEHKAAAVARYDDAIDRYSAALSLDPAIAQGILVRRSKAYMSKKSWPEALDDTSRVMSFDPLSRWDYDSVLVEWAKAEVIDGSWKDTLTVASSFKVPRFTVYRVICERLDMTGHIMNAISCLRQMRDELQDIAGAYDEHMKWALDFQQCCAKKLTCFGDTAVRVGRLQEAITQYSAALSLDPAAPQDILIKRSRAYMIERLWANALDDTNLVLTFNPSSPWGFDRVLMKWAEVELMYESWRDVLTTAGSFKAPRFMIYRALCECLEIVDRVTDAAECFHQLTSELAQEAKDEQAIWIIDFRSRCCRKSAYLGDVSMTVQQYDDAISLFSAALSLNPIDPLVLFVKRSKAYEGGGLWEGALNDANEIITLYPSSTLGYERKYVVLRGAGRHTDALSAFEMILLKMSQSLDPEIHKQSRRYARAKEAIHGAVQNAIRGSPQILINTASGRLCNKIEQATAFESLPVFLELITSTTAQIDHSRITREVTEYYRYAMFSHRWEDDEPLFEKVIHIAVYDLEESPTHDKLQMFCKVVRDAGFHWAWSDTCCINKADHHILQEALVLMFKWYEGSALTVALLRGVRPPSRRGDLVKSTWNCRAWTLQEYHASKVVRFYNEDWTPYLNLDIPNHKDSPEVIAEMEEATGISASALVALQPGPDDIRDKLCLASTRQTTRVEDAAYSLFGIFSISLPVVYGEGDKALGRLLAQLLTSSGDASILAWTGKSGSFNSCLPDNIAVFRKPPTTHISQSIQGAELHTAALQLLTLPLNLTLVMELYDRLEQTPAPFFVGQRMKLPCIAFKLGPVSAPSWEGSERIYRAQTIALGVVEIKTQEDLSRLDLLYLVHPWIDILLDRQPIGGATETIVEQNAVEPTIMMGAAESFPGASNTISATTQIRDGWFNFTRLGISLSGWPTATTAGDVASLRPPSSLTPAEKKMQAFQVLTRLRQPFGALLLTRNLGHVAAYRRVDAESLIMVQVEEITSVILNKLVSSVRVLDVL